MSVTCFVLAACAALPQDSAAPHFETEVLPVLTKAGCNAGSCHGAAAGRGGFHLSLWGSDPQADYAAIALEFEGRRVNLAHPEQSLILKKPTGDLDHEGGIPLPDDSPGAKRLFAWIAAGTPRGSHRPLKEFIVTPQTQVAKPGHAVVLRSEAVFGEGPFEDVTAWTVWKPADPASLTIDPKTMTATAHRPGQHILIARFLDRVVPIQILAPYASEAVDYSAEPTGHFIDDLILDRLKSLELPVSPLADSSMFLRRVTLDLSGRLPDPKAVEQFQKLESETQESIQEHRKKRVDELLDSDEFVDYWTFRLAELLRVGGQSGGEQAKVFHSWLKEQLRKRTPLDELARELITASGDPLQYGPANFYLVAGDARGQAEYVSQAFLGVRLRCANCHNHPLDRWTQDDYHGFAAVFAKVERTPLVREKAFGNVIHPKTGDPATPRLPGTRNLTQNGDLRKPVADWLTDPKNPYFSRAIVNRLWQAMMGRGLVHPTDDLSETNPATHPELLNRLAVDFVENGYDIRHTLRQIALSRAYQRSSQPVGINALDDRFYSRQSVRPLPAEVLADAWCDVTGVPESYPDMLSGTRATQLVSPKVESRSLDVLDRCLRNGECESASANEVTANLATTLHILNGEILNAKLTAANGRLQTLWSSKTREEEILTEFYLRAIAREPSEKELAYWRKQFQSLSASEDKRELLEDVLWSLLTSKRFTTNP